MPAKKTRKRGFGWVPDLPDHRDILFGVVRKVVAKLPPSVNLVPGCSPIEDQGQLGSCTGNALAGAVEFLEKKDGVPFVDVSRLFIYYNERVIEHSVNSDAGAMIRDGIKTLAKQGACSEKSWPYVISKFKVKPTPACYKEAAKHQIISYQRISTLDEMRTCLADGYPFVFGFTVYESFESQQVAKTGVVPMRNVEPGSRACRGPYAQTDLPACAGSHRLDTRGDRRLASVAWTHPSPFPWRRPDDALHGSH